MWNSLISRLSLLIDVYNDLMYRPLRGLLLLIHVFNDLTYVLNKVLRASFPRVHAFNEFICLL
jgi:hypothetical protein